jgi:large-conductance mechanosensitive channel
MSKTEPANSRGAFTPPKIAVEFGTFLNAANIAGLAIGVLIATSTLDTSKSLIHTTIMPLVQSIQTLKAPTFNLSPLIESLLTFIITMFIAFIIFRIGKVKPAPISLVQVVN